jgi:diguanylate cyclase (GGDEF)-like protein
MKKDKSVFFADISASTTTIKGELYLVGRFRDNTERKFAEEALRKSEQRYLELSIIDDLSKLYNSRHFYDQLEKEIERSKRYEQPLTLLLLDLDKFKIFNDTYGHVEGDHVLSRLGQVIKRCLRGPDSAYRYGGEEFTIILPMTTSEDGFATAERIQTEFRKEVFTPVSGKEVIVTMSIGFAQYKLNEDMKEFVHRVDRLMYQAKNNGRDKIFPELHLQEKLIL